ncbi:ATP-dependent helicase [Oceanicola sp. 22II-s10i]|uniref:ATP-dependent helicase HrpB n=1 Tax=Oceanicola sp. 22II-s10i TaxID=1317116 RepID=UPI000B6CF01B|nr:ATP-dependent helicase HrpB [Oceanicola sp. 22II-s10i]OWU85367.1 ATP-dependent helicase [Oceanicola sp. 22II-s10i]
MPRLPIHDALPDLIAALRDTGRAVLEAPPGAGKTTVVPLAMLEAGLTTGRIVMLEPRRLAARAAAARMADTLGEKPGETVGYRVRGEAKVSSRTRIEVVTEGILTRMIQSDPGLEGIGAVIFDEFHERSLNADFGLALCLEIAGALRDDLILVAMSATLDAAPVAALMEAPRVTSEGRMFPVDTRWLDRPLARAARMELALADLVMQAAAETEGGILVFLPGEGEIRRVESLLRDRLPPGHHIRPLFGAMDLAAQRAAIRPETEGRKVVLSTSIAETSLTIEDIRVVIDAGLARRSRFDPGSGMARLVTERVTRAEADQRRGRAGRVAEGVCYRLWTKGEEGALAAYPPAGIEVEDLAPLALDLALWGAEPEAMPFLTQPNPGVMAEARALLTMLGALDGAGLITAHGRQLATMPLHPRLGHMVLKGGRSAPLLAALMQERDILPRGAASDLTLRMEAARDPARFERAKGWTVHRGALERARAEARRLDRLAGGTEGPDSVPELAALAYPDRVGLRRPGDAPRYLLSGGKGAVMEPGDPLAGSRLIVATDLDGDPREAKVRQAAALSESALRGLFAEQIGWADVCEWSRRERRVVARRQERFGAIALDDRVWTDAPQEAVARAMLDGVRELGLPAQEAARLFRARVALARAAGHDLPDMSDAALMAGLEDWLLPHLGKVRTADQWKGFDLMPALRGMLDWDAMQLLDRIAPSRFTTPLGREIPIDYSGEAPAIELRLQELFGQTAHPQVAGQPLRITLLSPAGRPVQVTMDLPGFWASSYADVRKDMRGRYPKHPWPEDPTEADPTLRAKPRK